MSTLTRSPAPLPTWSPVHSDLPAWGLRCWPLPQVTVRLGGTQAWLVAWDPAATTRTQDRWWDLLDPPERRRSATIGTEAGRMRYVASHAAAHVLVPDQRIWRAGRASLSHSRSLAAIATAPGAIGVDIEADRPRPGWRSVDRRLWPGSPATDWSDFLRRWVVTEAAFKLRREPAREPADPDVEVVRVTGLPELPDHIMALAAG